MNAKELLCKLDGGGQMWIEGATDDEEETILRALRLLAAAEANDGTTPETDAAFEDAFPNTMEVCKLLERERNGLAARVGELEPNAERYRWLRDYGNHSPSDFPAIRIQQGPAWSCRIIGGSRADAAIDAARGKP